MAANDSVMISDLVAVAAARPQPSVVVSPEARALSDALINMQRTTQAEAHMQDSWNANRYIHQRAEADAARLRKVDSEVRRQIYTIRTKEMGARYVWHQYQIATLAIIATVATVLICGTARLAGADGAIAAVLYIAVIAAYFVALFFLFWVSARVRHDVWKPRWETKESKAAVKLGSVATCGA
jgi:hypothetical protein